MQSQIATIRASPALLAGRLSSRAAAARYSCISGFGTRRTGQQDAER
jgi:hypothetical protein